MPDGRLWLLRDTYTVQTAWAPPYVGKELRLARLGAFDAALSAIRADAEAQAARKAGHHDLAGQQETLAVSYRALRGLYQQREHTLGQAMASRQDWEQTTAGSRHLAIAADTELRHPGRMIEPLRSAEPAPVSDTERELKLSDTATRIRDHAVQHQASREKTGQRQRSARCLRRAGNASTSPEQDSRLDQPPDRRFYSETATHHPPTRL